MNVRTDHSTFSPSLLERFGAAVVLTIGGVPAFIETVQQARTCLIETFTDQDGSSFKRAMAACDACLLGSASGTTASIMFVVAMEAGFPFEVIEDPTLVMERRTDLAAEAGLRSIIWNETFPA